MKLKSQEIEIKRFIAVKGFNFGAKIKEIRIRNKLTAAELGDILGVQDIQVGRYERGIALLSNEKIVKIVKALNVSPIELLGIVEVDARENPETAIIYDWELRVTGIYWICPACREFNIYSGDQFKVDLEKNELAVECEHDNCGEYYDNFWRLV